jgi:hypothetical protein
MELLVYAVIPQAGSPEARPASALPSGQNGSTYLKDPSDALRLNRIFRQKGIPIFPNAVVQASVCRSELLCEMEVIAVLAPRKS